jgi:thiol-disulfide isomerase/thioredoxin
MKLTLLIIFLLATYFTRAQLKIINKQFYVTGKIIGQENGIVSLSYINSEGKQVKDSCFLQNGNFYFRGEIIEPTLAVLRGAIKSLADDDPNSAGVYLEPGKITAIAEKNHFNEIKIIGSKTQSEYEALQRKYETVSHESDSAYEKFAEINYLFITTHPDSYVSAFQLALYATRWSVDTVRMLYNRLKPKIQESLYGKDVSKTINGIDNNSSGKIAKIFTNQDINGQSINLLNFRGKYVLLDFWASWCIPCRQGTPHLIQLFKKYHDEGLNIIGVSDDDNVKAWKMAIEKEGVGIWYNILSVIKINSTGHTNKTNKYESISEKFGIHVLPTKILIDKSGLIIGRYTGIEEEPMLDKKLKEVFK